MPYIYQELGYALSWGAELIDKLTEAGYSIEELTSRIKFVFGVGSNYFMELAKFRAARWLWAEIIGAYGDQYKGDAAKIHMHAVTSTWNKTSTMLTLTSFVHRPKRCQRPWAV